jgi:hypothetical protein
MNVGYALHDYVKRFREEETERKHHLAALADAVAMPQNWKHDRSGHARVAPELVVVQEFLAQFSDTELLAGARPIGTIQEPSWEPFFAVGDRPFTPIKSYPRLRDSSISGALKALCSHDVLFDPTLQAGCRSLKLALAKTDPEADRCISIELEAMANVRSFGIVLWWVETKRSYLRQHDNFTAQNDFNKWDAGSIFSIRSRALQANILASLGYP